MNLIHRYQPSLSWLHEINRFIDRNTADPSISSGPRELFHESPDAWILQLDLPGYQKSDITLNVTHRILRLTTIPSDKPFTGNFERQWKLSDDIDETAITARLENGVFELTLPKRPQAEPQAITIEVQ